MSRREALSYCGGCSPRCRLPKGEEKKKMAVLLPVRFAGGFLLAPAFLQTGEMPGATVSLSAAGLIRAEGWIAGYKREALFEEGGKKIQHGGEEVFLAVEWPFLLLFPPVNGERDGYTKRDLWGWP